MIESPESLEVETSNQNSAPSRRWLWSRIIRGMVTLFIPILLTLISVRLVMTEQFLQLEYHRPGFPEDQYGFSTSERLNFALYAMQYLLNDANITYLSSLNFNDGRSLFNERELQHMVDVKTVTRTAFDVLYLGLILFAAIFVLAWRLPTLRPDLLNGLSAGSILTLLIIFTIVVIAIVAWDTFFNNFHNLFFASGTWRFAYSDTLIRLFPEQFWFDASLVIGILTALFAVIILAATRFAAQNMRKG